MSLVPITTKQHGDTIKLKMADGKWREFWFVDSTVTAEGEEGIKIIDKTPTTKRAFDSDNTNKFNPNDTNNIAYYLNNGYYNSLSESTKKMLINADWPISSSVKANVGLLSRYEFIRRGAGNTYYGGKLPVLSSDEWTIENDAGSNHVIYVTSGSGEVIHAQLASSLAVARPALVLKTDLFVSDDGSVIGNQSPTVTLDTPKANQTLYENDVLSIAGTAKDADIGNSVTVRYQVNANTVRAIKAFVSTGAAESFSKQLTFKSGSLYDGDTLIASNLVDGTAHTLKVWATDDQGGQSTIVERTFYVVPNRAPSLTVNAPSTAGNTDGDTITINGQFNDPDGNTAKVNYRINGSNGVQIAEGVSGDFEFDVSFAQLQLGVNNIVVEVIDSHGSKTSRTVKFNKTALETPILKSTARYKVQPPTGSASAILFWITRDENLQLDAFISMTMQGEQETFVAIAASNSAPSPDFANAIEDEFYYEANSLKDNITLQLDLTRASLEVNPKVYIIQGVLE